MTNLAAGDDHRGYCILRHVKGDAEGTGKRARVVAFCSEAGLLVKAYLRSVNRSYGPIFDLSDVAIGQMVERYALAAGIEGMSPHALRRCLADYWDEVNGAAGREMLKRQLGHTSGSPDVTEKHYISRNHRRIARELLKMHVSPVGQVGLNWSALPVHIP
jgi:integrase